jgi:uncharacterized membrane protein HdeD (DUF308 family)
MGTYFIVVGLLNLLASDAFSWRLWGVLMIGAGAMAVHAALALHREKNWSIPEAVVATLVLAASQVIFYTLVAPQSQQGSLVSVLIPMLVPLLCLMFLWSRRRSPGGAIETPSSMP